MRTSLTAALAPTAAGALLLAGVALAGRPTTPPPKVTGVKAAPPPAWVQSGTRSVWAAFGSYCWRTACVDMIPPAGRPDLPVLRVSRGAVVGLHLGFVPRSVSVKVGSTKLAASYGRTKVVTWHARAGIAAVNVKGPGGSASYLVRLR
jgi:hypothetical protein